MDSGDTCMTTIFGYGSLMDIQSCQRTLPNACSFRQGMLPDYCRKYNLVSISGIRSGKANLNTKEMAALSIGPAAGKCVLGCLFEIPSSELASYLHREHRYRAVQLPVVNLNDNNRILAWTVVEQTDADYAAKIANEELSWEVVVGQYYTGSLWGRLDIFPLRNYMVNCVLAAELLGGTEFVQNMLDVTWLADGERTLRAYLLDCLERGDEEVLCLTSQLFPSRNDS